MRGVALPASLLALLIGTTPLGAAARPAGRPPPAPPPATPSATQPSTAPAGPAAAPAVSAPAVPAPAGPAPPGSAGAQFQNVAGFDHIQTDDVQYNLNTGEFTLKNRFTASRQGTDITADHATGNSRKKLLHAVGHVVVHQNQPLQNRGKTTDLTQKPSTLTCDKLDADGVRQLFTAVGNVHFTQENREATADSATLDDLNHHLHMVGRVHVRGGEQSIDADVLDYDTLTGEVEGHGNVTIVSPVETPTPGPPGAKGKQKRK
jgi:lipopolysaccharide assembly outer membrane protein LptD (OstA)